MKIAVWVLSAIATVAAIGFQYVELRETSRTLVTSQKKLAQTTQDLRATQQQLQTARDKLQHDETVLNILSPTPPTAEAQQANTVPSSGGPGDWAAGEFEKAWLAQHKDDSAPVGYCDESHPCEQHDTKPSCVHGYGASGVCLDPLYTNRGR